MISSSRQQGDNPATLNPVGIADPNSYTVGGAMETGDSENYGSEAVSYTHLTLPTICSV